jgi:hypothetical protein
MGSKGSPYRARTIDGFEVLVGRGDPENDRLTFEIAAPEDFWLHVADVPGSHVVVCNPQRLDALPRCVHERAASLAAWHSKARDAARVEVHVRRVADVRKRRGSRRARCSFRAGVPCGCPRPPGRDRPLRSRERLTRQSPSRTMWARSQDGERSSTVRALDCGSRG